jgi:hypothetical protein
VIAGACAGPERTRADRLAHDGAYEDAAALYARLVDEQPGDRGLRTLRDRAQARAVERLTREAQEARLAHGQPSEAAEALGHAIELRRRYRHQDGGGDGSQFLSFPLDAEVQAFGTELRAALGRLAERAPLRAVESRRAEDAVLRQPELQPVRLEIDRAIDAAAGKACTRLRGASRPSQLYLGALISRYCQRFGLALDDAPVPPDLRGSLAVDGAPNGVEAADVAWLRDRLDDWFARTAWHSPRTRRAAVARLRGSVDVRFTTEHITVDAPWTEQVPYSATESYQESYTDTEMRSELVTTYESYSYPCGTSTCTGSRPVSHTELRSYPVTRYRTATRTVTRYRPEPRLFQYPADRVTGEYASTLRVKIELADGEPPVAVRIDHADKRSGLRHDVTFAPAGVAPSQPRLATASDWVRVQAVELEQAFRDALEARWRERFCAAEDYSPEEAARCLGAKSDPPPAVREALRALFGDDLEPLLNRASR